MKRIAAAAALIALLVAAPASAKLKTLYYDGETVDGNSLSFTLTGNRISEIDGYVTTTCVSGQGGTPRLSPGEFNPPGAFVFGRTRKVSKTEYMSYKGDVTKNYTITVKQKKGRVWTADLHVNYSYSEIIPVGVGELDQTFYVCQGDDEFDFRV
jgi:hypothetical protein